MITIVDGPDKGTITGINPVPGSITYKHTGSGDDSFTYKLTDAKGAVSERRHGDGRRAGPTGRCRSTASPTSW